MTTAESKRSRDGKAAEGLSDCSDPQFLKEVEALGAVANRKNRRWAIAFVLALPLLWLGGYWLGAVFATIGTCFWVIILDRRSVHERDLLEESTTHGVPVERLRDDVDVYAYGQTREGGSGTKIPPVPPLD